MKQSLPIDNAVPSLRLKATAQMNRIFLKQCVPLLVLFASSVFGADTNSASDVIRVGPNRPVKTITEAVKRVVNGGRIEVDAGEYRSDVAVWADKTASIKAVGGRVLLDAAGASAEGKAIWVIRGGTIEVDGFDFMNTAVRDKNGAGIRFERGHLVVRNSTFRKNENGILTGGDNSSVLEIENCEFGYNGFGDGQSHNLYVGTIARLSVIGSYFHHANVGHLLKSRAAENHIFYNRFTDETGGRASYEIELPNGGQGYIVGNLIQQSSTTENPNIVSYGVEGGKWTNNVLYLVNNTLVDNRPRNGVFLRVRQGAGTVTAVNNLLVGQSKLDSSASGEYANNINVDWDEFVLAAREDFRLRPGSKLRGKGIEPPEARGIDLRPDHEYTHPRSTRAIKSRQLSPGAFQD